MFQENLKWYLINTDTLGVNGFGTYAPPGRTWLIIEKKSGKWMEAKENNSLVHLRLILEKNKKI